MQLHIFIMYWFYNIHTDVLQNKMMYVFNTPIILCVANTQNAAHIINNVTLTSVFESIPHSIDLIIMHNVLIFVWLWQFHTIK